MSKVFIFDVDGVIVDSTEECMVVTWNTIQTWENKTDFLFKVDDIPADFAKHFKAIRNYIRGMHEYLVVPNTQFGDIVSQTTFEAELSKLDNNDLDRFGKIFFSQREKLKERSKEEWIDLHIIYPGIIDFIKKVREKYELYVVTGKDRDSVIDFFQYFSIPLDFNRIYDKEIAKNKMEGINTVAKLEKVDLSEVIFLDDNITHLVTPFEAGVNCYMASWGYGMPEHFKTAEELKVKTIELKEINKIIE